MKAEEVWALGPTEWRAMMREGHPIAPDALAGWAYRGTSLGLPGPIERITWKSFQKCFHRDAPGAPLRGWNVRLEQHGVRAPSEPMRDRRGVPRTFGHFAVVEARGRGVPHGFDRGLLLDYGCPGLSGISNGALDPTSRLRDPLVSLEAGSAELLLGWSYLSVAGRAIDTPSFFTIERDAPIEHVPAR